MHTTSLRKVGGSVMLAVPPALLDLLHLAPGARVGVGVRRGALIVEPRPRYRLKELLTEESTRRRAKRDREWVAGRPAGRELI
ncbi:MAG TPA: hypothetical protein VMG40_03960 [Bryobacteraceae bacterium]|nr:hypothetical protein [Bryobacteraceae bacterium]